MNTVIKSWQNILNSEKEKTQKIFENISTELRDMIRTKNVLPEETEEAYQAAVDSEKQMRQAIIDFREHFIDNLMNE